MAKNTKIDKESIQHKALKKISDYFDLSMADLKEIDKNSLWHLQSMAKIGMQFEKEMNIQQRAHEMNFVRIGKLVQENKEELKKYIKRSLPQYF